MDKFESYKLQKEKASYLLVKQGKLFEKARAVIVENGKVLILFNPIKQGYTVPGGGVDPGETVLQAVVREAMEESGYLVEPIKEIFSRKYDVPMQFNGEKFISHRVEYFYLCKIKDLSEANANGIEGEFDCQIEKQWRDFDDLKLCGWSEENIKSLKSII